MYRSLSRKTTKRSGFAVFLATAFVASLLSVFTPTPALAVPAGYGTEVEVCDGQQGPEGWLMVRNTACGKIRKYVEGAPAGTQFSVCTTTYVPVGWVYTGRSIAPGCNNRLMKAEGYPAGKTLKICTGSYIPENWITTGRGTTPCSTFIRNVSGTRSGTWYKACSGTRVPKDWVITAVGSGKCQIDLRNVSDDFDGQRRYVCGIIPDGWGAIGVNSSRTCGLLIQKGAATTIANTVVRWAPGATIDRTAANRVRHRPTQNRTRIRPTRPGGNTPPSTKPPVKPVFPPHITGPCACSPPPGLFF